MKCTRNAALPLQNQFRYHRPRRATLRTEGKNRSTMNRTIETSTKYIALTVFASDICYLISRNTTKRNKQNRQTQNEKKK